MRFIWMTLADKSSSERAHIMIAPPFSPVLDLLLGLAGEHMSSEQHDKGASGSVLLVDGTIFAVQADPNLANSGFSISLLEKSSAIGGIMVQLVNTLPTNEYAASMISSDLVEVGGIHHTSLSACELTKYATGRERYFQARIPQTHSYADLIGVA